MFGSIRKSKDGNSLLFQWKGVRLPEINAIRRIIISEVPCLAIQEVEIQENTSIYMREFLQHRALFLPIQALLHPTLQRPTLAPEECDCVTKECNRCLLTLQLNKTNSLPLHSWLTVPVNSQDALPAGYLKPNLTLVELNPGQKIHLTLKVRKDTPRFSMHPQFAVASKATWPTARYQKTEEGKEPLTWQEINDSQRFFTTDFCLESIGQIPPEKIFREALQILRQKLMRLRDSLID